MERKTGLTTLRVDSTADPSEGRESTESVVPVGLARNWYRELSASAIQVAPCRDDSTQIEPLRSAQQLRQIVVESDLISREALDDSLEDPSLDGVFERIDLLAWLLVQRKILNRGQVAALCRGDLQKLTLGNYLIEKELGRGGMGTVYKALDRKRQLHVALKMLHRGGGTEISRLKHEFRALADLVHPNLVVRDELRYVDRRWFFTMELVEGKHFTQYVRGPHERDGPKTSLTERTPEANDRIEGETTDAATLRCQAQFVRLRRCLEQLVQGLYALHERGKLHCDVKPSNVLVTSEGRVVLVDFGLVAKLDADPGRTVGESAGGTLPYMAPEQCTREPPTKASDSYGVGVMLFETLVGRKPFAREFAEMFRQKCAGPPPFPAGLIPAEHADLARLCTRLLSPAPNARPVDGQILAQLGGKAGSAALPLRLQDPEEQHSHIGRKEELRQLQQAFGDVQRGSSVMVLVHGRSGMGKTALVQHFLGDLESKQEVIILRGGCHPRESVPYKALDSIVDALMNHLAALPPEEIRRALPSGLTPLLHLFPQLRQLSAVRAAGRRAAAALVDGDIRRSAIDALRELFRRLARDAPVVAFVDDLQWGGLDSAMLLLDLLRPPQPPPLLLIGCCETYDVETSPCLRKLLQAGRDGSRVIDQRHVDLRPLSSDEACELAQVLSTCNCDDKHRRPCFVARESEGSPYFIRELVRHPQGKRSDCRGTENPPPVDLEGMLLHRINVLSAPARELLNVIAIAGHPVELDDAWRATGESREPCSAVALLKSEHFIRVRGISDDEELEVYHHRIQEVVIESLSSSRQEDYHRRLARALEASPRANPEVLYVHFFLAGDRRNALRNVIVAADRAAEMWAYGRAAELYRVALSMGLPDTVQRQEVEEKLHNVLRQAPARPSSSK